MTQKVLPLGYMAEKDWKGTKSEKSDFEKRSINAKGSRRNKFTILGVEAPVGQGAKTQEYRDISSFRNAARRDASSYIMSR